MSQKNPNGSHIIHRNVTSPDRSRRLNITDGRTTSVIDLCDPSSPTINTPKYVAVTDSAAMILPKEGMNQVIHSSTTRLSDDSNPRPFSFHEWKECTNVDSSPIGKKEKRNKTSSLLDPRNDRTYGMSSRNEIITVDMKETEQQRKEREMAESEELARRLMAEEAMESYRQSAAFFQSHASEYSEDDLAMIRVAMGYSEGPQYHYEADTDGDNEEEDDGEEDGADDAFLHNNYNEEENEEEEDDYDDDDEYDEEQEETLTSSEMSYDALLRLSERIGDVKTERWMLKAKQEISKLPIFRFTPHHFKDGEINDTNLKCLICQLQYEEAEELRSLPCQHQFHRECVDPWLMKKDFCPYCRQQITST